MPRDTSSVGTATTTPDAFTAKEKRYLEIVDSYFRENPKNFHKAVDIIQQRSEISLRVLEHFILKYARVKKVCYVLTLPSGAKERFNVPIEYKAQLKTYKKKYFDPFRRNPSRGQPPMKFDYAFEGKTYRSSLGQLNFFKWAIETGVLAYVEEHLTEIINDMNISAKVNKNIKKVATKKVTCGTEHVKITAREYAPEGQKVIFTLSFDL